MYKNFNIVNRLTAIIAMFLLFVLFASAQTAATKLTDQQITTKADEYMNAAVKVEGFSGSVLVARYGKPIFDKGYGMANIELGVPNSPNTVYRLGSVTKQFTGMAITMLQERGKLSVSDPLCKYVAACPDAWKPITIKNLLTHTSGIPNYTGFPDFAKTTILPISTTEMTDLLKSKPLDFAPDEKFSYSNSGFYMLGVIIEKVSGKTYADFLQENIFTPLKMKDTGYDNPLVIIKNRAAGYQREAGKIMNASYMDMSVPYAAGSLYSTTGDLLLWDQALYTEKLVSKKSLDEILTPYKSGYGYGWGIGKKFEHRSISHGGGIYGFATEISRYPDDNVTVVVLSNVQAAPSGKIAEDLAAVVFGAAYEIPKERTEIQVDAKILEKYVGDYQLAAPKIIISFALENGRLFGVLGGQSKFALSAESETVFFSKDAPVQITFIKDANGQTTGMTFKQGTTVIPAQKIK